jgi:multidrug efflux pump subunit AcrB
MDQPFRRRQARSAAARRSRARRQAGVPVSSWARSAIGEQATHDHRSDEHPPADVSFDYGGKTFEQEADDSTMAIAFAFALVMVVVVAGIIIALVMLT